jgi:hypothetical protein
MRALFAGIGALLLAGSIASSSHQSDTRQEILRSHYRLFGQDGPLGYTELTELRRTDGSRSYLARERMEFWGPVLERFVVLTFDSEAHFDSGHWVGTSDYSQHFSYTFRFDGRAIRGDWVGSVRGSGWSEVPTRPENPVIGFWGPLDSLVLTRFDPEGPDRQSFDAVDVEDSHHRLLTIAVERLGTEEIDVPAGRITTTRYQSERFGATQHWVDEKGTLIRWASENDRFRWDLTRAPSEEPLPRKTRRLASGAYEVTSSAGGPHGSVPWSLEQDDAGDYWLFATEELDRRISRFEGRLDSDWKWLGSTETVDWVLAEGQGPPEIHHLETFFYPDKLHLLRFRDRAYPVLQTRSVHSPVPFHLVNYPISALAWLRQVPRESGEESLPELAHIANRYRGGGMEVQEATVGYLGRLPVEGPSGPVPGHHFELRYPGGWEDSTFEYWTDGRLVPLHLKMFAGEGALEYRLVEYEVQDGELLPVVP